MKNENFSSKKNKKLPGTMTKLIRVVMILLNLLAVLAFVLLKIGTIVSPNDMLLPAYASLAFVSGGRYFPPLC